MAGHGLWPPGTEAEEQHLQGGAHQARRSWQVAAAQLGMLLMIHKQEAQDGEQPGQAEGYHCATFEPQNPNHAM